MDKIFRRLLKYGRPAPEYSRTGRESVVVRLPTDAADLDFRRLVVEEERRRSAELPIDSLIALAALCELKRITADELASRIERDAAGAKRTFEALTEAGLVETHGATRARATRCRRSSTSGPATRRPIRARRVSQPSSTSRWC